jgi:CDP-diacylglycerol--glycerol-3-phosphate 3-phosphatidyltransferase|tara:strand:+ start:29582 stop:30133 length:552 start_codon:yes stop_codon:yes gene_type:complete
MNYNLPILLTFIRAIFIPLIVFLFFLPFEWTRPATGALFLIAALTDWLDGFLARKLNQVTDVGAFLDPIADKLLVSSCLILLLYSDPTIFLALITLIIIAREITISSLREWISGLEKGKTLAVTNSAKWKTAFQMIGIGLMLYQKKTLGLPIYEIGLLLLFLATLLTLWSMFEYLKTVFPYFR